TRQDNADPVLVMAVFRKAVIRGQLHRSDAYARKAMRVHLVQTFAHRWESRVGDGYSRFVEWRIRQHHRGPYLSIGDAPIGLEQRGLALSRHQLEAVLPIEADRPVGGGPGANQHRPRTLASQLSEQRTADAATLVDRQDVRVADEIEVAHRLKAHHTDQPAV